MKIFLSHSSTDKTIVRKVYEELGASLCHFDEATFDPTGHIPTQIYEALNGSTHFVFFASRVAIASGWVQGELQTAFESWMKAGVRRAMVFLLDGADVQDLPEWLRKFVLREPPSYRHILCRIQSEIDREINAQRRPPFYRHKELKQLETDLLVESTGMPGAILAYGPDGSGRKELINELYDRQFTFVARRKLLIPAPTFITEKELYRDVIGLTTIATPQEFSAIFREFNSRSYQGRMETLAKTIVDTTAGGQAILLDGEQALFSDEGRLQEWFCDLVLLLAAKDYPRLAVTGSRRPFNLPVKMFGKLLIQELPALDKDDSKILFNWWLKILNKPYTSSLKDTVYDACMGSPKQLELGAKLLVAEGGGSVSKIRPHLLHTLEGLSRQFLGGLSDSTLNATVLAFVAHAGYVVRSDLTQYLVDTGIAGSEAINESVASCSSYGFLVEDEVCLRMPNYLVRGARAIGRDRDVQANLKMLFEHQGKVAGSLALDELTSVPLLNEYALSLLRRGENVGPVFESIILPSQCVIVARAMYESEQYDETLALCERAYQARAALSKDGLVEALRYMGMAAARLSKVEDFIQATERLLEVGDSVKATRIANFLKGFSKRLDGKFDEALSFLNAAYKAKGEHDIHVLRELASVTLNMDDVAAARKYIRAALSRAGYNQYVIEMAVRVELGASPPDVAKRSAEIEQLLESLYAFDNSPDKIYWVIVKCEYLLALNEVKAAEEFLDSSSYQVGHAPILDMLKARIAMRWKHFVKAQKLLQELYKKTKSLKTGQRQSTLPLICRSLVEASAANKLSEGVEWYETCRPYLPSRVARTLANEMIEAAAFAREKLTPAQLAYLKQCARS